MIIGVYAMKDALNGFMNVFPEQNDDAAKRGFIHAMRTAKPDTLFYSNPDDYALYKLGEFDTTSGVMEVLPTPLYLVGGQECK